MKYQEIENYIVEKISDVLKYTEEQNPIVEFEATESHVLRLHSKIEKIISDLVDHKIVSIVHEPDFHLAVGNPLDGPDVKGYPAYKLKVLKRSFFDRYGEGTELNDKKGPAISYDVTRDVLHINDKSVDFSRDPHKHALLRIIFAEGEPVGRVWGIDEIMEGLGDLDLSLEATKKRGKWLQSTIRHVNEKMMKTTSIMAFLRGGSKSVRINPDYIK